MRFLIFLEYAFFALLLLVFFSQVFLPLWRGTPLFPIFRRERKLEERLTALRQEDVEAHLETNIAQEEAKLGRRRRTRKAG